MEFAEQSDGAYLCYGNAGGITFRQSREWVAENAVSNLPINYSRKIHPRQCILSEWNYNDGGWK